MTAERRADEALPTNPQRPVQGGAVAAPAPTGAKPAEGNIDTFHSLQYRDFRFLWVGTVFASLGQWIQIATLGWVVYDLTGSSALLGAIGGMRSIPMLFLAPFAGVASDRMSRRTLLMGSQLAMLVLAFAVGVALLFDRLEIWHLFVFTLLAGTAMIFNMPVRQAMIFDLVPRPSIANAIALMTSAFNFTQVLGPTFAGLLLGTVGATGNFFLQSVAYFAVLVSLFFIKMPPPQAVNRAESVGRNIAEGFRFVSKEPTIRMLLLIGLINPLFVAPPLFSLMPVFAKDIFQTGPSGLGLLLGAMGLGGLTGGLVTASLGKFERRGVLQLGALLGMTVSVMAFALMPNQWAATPFLFTAGFSQMVYMTTNQTIIQLLVPNAMRGRVNAIMMLNMGLMPLGGIVAGVGAELMGAPRLVMTLSGIAMVIALLVIAFVPRMRTLRLSELVGSRPAGEAVPVGRHG